MRTLQVLDVATGHAGSMAAMLLAELGANVVRLDLPGATPSDGRGAIWNRGKQRIALADDAALAGAVADRLAATDIILVDRLAESRRAIGLGDSALAAHPHLVLATIGSWPEGHPLQDIPVDDALVLARAGFFDEQRAAGRDGPMYIRLPIASLHASWLAVIGILARLWARRRDGTGGHVRTSLLQGALVPQMMHWQRAEHPTLSIAMGMPKTMQPQIFVAGDDLWFHVCGDVRASPRVRAALDAMGADGRAEANAPYGEVALIFSNDHGAASRIFRTMPRDFWLDEYRSCDVSIEPVQPMGSLYDDAQARANGYVVPVEDPVFGPTLQPGNPIGLAPSAAPFGNLDAPLAGMPGDAPLAGIRVLDFGSYLAGPLGPMILADLGADVIKVESPQGDILRRGAEWAFNACQRGKRSIVLAMKDGGARTEIAALVASADIIHHNIRMPGAERLGLSFAAAAAIRPGIIYTHVSSYGPRGERRDWPGFDQLFQAASGWELAGAGDGNDPIWYRFGMMDHLCALASAAGTLVALLRRDMVDGPQFVSASILGASLLTSETIRCADGSLTDYARLDAAQMGVSPVRRIYRTTDGWITVAAGDGDAHAAARLTAVAGEDAAAWFSATTTSDALADLDRHGLPAVATLLDQRDPFLDDEDNHHARLTQAWQHPTLGRFKLPGVLVDCVGLPQPLDCPPPMLGEHGEEIMAELAARMKPADDSAGANGRG